MAKRRTAHPKRGERLVHLSADELTELSRLGAQISAVRKSVPRRTIVGVAELAGINSSALGELERGRGNATYVVLLRIASACGVPVSALIPVSSVDATLGDGDEASDPVSTGEEP